MDHSRIYLASHVAHTQSPKYRIKSFARARVLWQPGSPFIFRKNYLYIREKCEQNAEFIYIIYVCDNMRCTGQTPHQYQLNHRILPSDGTASPQFDAAK